MELEECAEIFRTLSDPNRLQLVRILRQQPSLCVGDLAQVAKIPQPAASYHLRILKAAGLIHCRKVKNSRFYEVDTAKIDKIQKLLLEFGAFMKNHAAAPHETSHQVNKN